MIEYSVVLKRHTSSSKPDTILFRDEDREVAISEMQKYYKKNGFTIYDKDGHYTISNIILVEQESIVGAPILSVTKYCDLFDVFDRRK
jgi:hypothetical protein